MSARKIAKISLITISILYLTLISHSNAAQCSSLTTSLFCGGNPSCEWNSDTNECYCGVTAPLDIMFMLDESNSMWKVLSDLQSIHDGFGDAKTFVAGMIQGGVSEASNIHIAKFSKSMRNVYNFTQNQSNSIVHQALLATEYRDPTAAAPCVATKDCWNTNKYPTATKIKKCVNKCNGKFGNTRTLDSVKYAINVFNSWNSNPNANSGKLFVLITDGRPYPRPGQSPCPKVKELHDAVGGNVIIVGLGPGWKFDDYTKCLITPGYDYDNPDPSKVYDPKRIITVPTWSQQDFIDAGISTGGFLCPNAFSLKFTEIHIEEWNNIYHPRFVEFYNDGATLRLNVNDLKFDGFMTSNPFGITGNSQCNITIPADTYIVFYDPTGDMPNCPGCNCTLNGNDLWCDEALYIPCDSDPATSTCGSCTWNMTMTNMDWSQSVSDGMTSDILSEAIRNANINGYLNIAEGYSSELLSPDAVLSPANWKMSCNYSGTPGAPMIAPCNISCVISVCQAQGDVNATCAGANQADRCVCSASNHYYLSPSSGCIFLPAPINCEVYSTGYNEDFGKQVTEIFWFSDPNAVYTKGVYFEIDYTGVEKRKSYGYQTMLFKETPAETLIEVYAVYEDEVNGNVESDRVTCQTYTIAPTSAPTPSPTESNANIDWCYGDIDAYNIINLRWQPAYPGESTDIISDPHYTYYIYGNWIEGDDNTAITPITTVGIENEKLIFNGILDIDNNGAPEIYVVTVIEDFITGNPDIERMKTDGQGKIQCIINTNPPTKTPSKNPSKTPTETPSKSPTKYPTSSPTYAPWILNSCHLDIGNMFGTSFKQISIGFDYNRQSDSSETAIIILSYGINQKEFPPPTGGIGNNIEWNTAWLITEQDEKNELNNAIINNNFKAKIQYKLFDETLDFSIEIPCEFTTPHPTISPTNNPSKFPTISPTNFPTKYPSKYPTNIPTQSPTFKSLTLDSCIARISSNLQGLDVIFTEAFYNDNDPNKPYPFTNDIKYLIKVGDTKEQHLFAEQPEQQHIVSFSLDTGYFIVGTTSITIDIQSITTTGLRYGDINLPIICDLITNAPTKAPTTPSPTKFPTQDNPIVYFDIINKDWGFDGECLFPDIISERRLADDDNNSDGYLINSCSKCVDHSCIWCPPVCPVTENSDEKYIYIVREPVDFKYYIQIDISLQYLTDSNGKSLSIQDFDLQYKQYSKRKRQQWSDLFKSKSDPNNDQYITFYIPGGSDNQLKIPYSLTVNKQIKEPTEYFEIRLHGCQLDESDGVEPDYRVPIDLIGVIPCGLGSKYPAAIIEIQQPPEDDTFTSTTMGDMPTWVWYPIGFAALAIPFVAYLIWRFYNAKKAADAMEVVRKFELGEAEKQDDVGEFGVIGDQITANPIATGNAFEINKEDVLVNTQLQFEKMNFEVATVQTEHNIFKQDFGPVQAQKNTLISGSGQQSDDI